MGLGPSLPKPPSTSPEDIRTRLIDKLYGGLWPDVLESLRSLFLERCSEDGTLTQDAFVYLLAEGEVESYVEMLNEAGPILYRLAIYHGFYPFAPAIDSRLTLDTFLLSLAMMTHCADRLGDGGTRSGGRNLRDAEDAIRLCFQALAQSNHVTSPINGDRDTDRDLFSAMRNLDGTEGKFCFSIQALAATLPPSSSRDRSGVIPMKDLRTLVKLMLALSTPTPPSTHPGDISEAAERICRLFGDTDAATVDFPTFRAAVRENLPNLFEPLRIFIKHHLHILDRKPLTATPPPPFATSSKIITALQTSQLCFVLHVFISPNFQERIHSSAPSCEAAEAISALTHQQKNRLLLMSARNADTAWTFAVLVCSELDESCRSYRRIRPETGIDRSCSVELAPRHSVLFASSTEREENEVGTKIVHDRDRLVIQQGQGMWRFSKGLERVELVRPGEKAEELDVCWLEIWSE